MRAGVDDEQLSAALSRDVVASLCDPQSGPRLIHRLGQRIGTEARLALAAESLKVTGHCDGLTELSDEVLDWLAEGISAPAPSELTQAHPGNATWNRAVLRGARAQHLGAADAADRCAWLWWLRICGSQRFEQAVAAEVWEPADLLAAAGGAPPGLSVLPTLRRSTGLGGIGCVGLRGAGSQRQRHRGGVCGGATVRATNLAAGRAH